MKINGAGDIKSDKTFFFNFGFLCAMSLFDALMSSSVDMILFFDNRCAVTILINHYQRPIYSLNCNDKGIGPTSIVLIVKWILEEFKVNFSALQ